ELACCGGGGRGPYPATKTPKNPRRGILPPPPQKQPKTPTRRVFLISKNLIWNPKIFFKKKTTPHKTKSKI
ncbi:hypothetical protein ACVGW7_00195, partial [Enterobacter intestinihominis]